MPMNDENYSCSYSRPRLKKAYRKGRNAGYTGSAVPGSCPYDTEPLKSAWLNGSLRGTVMRGGVYKG